MLTCSICELATVANVDEAIAKDWHPNWFEGETQKDPCCGKCGQFLHDAGDGELELIPGIDSQPTTSDAPASNDAPTMTEHDIDRERFAAEKDDWQL